MLTQQIENSYTNLLLNMSAQKNELLDGFFELNLQDYSKAFEKLTINFQDRINDLIKNQLDEAQTLFDSDEFIIEHTTSEHVTGHNIPANGYEETETDDVCNELSGKIQLLQSFLYA